MGDFHVKMIGDLFWGHLGSKIGNKIGFELSFTFRSVSDKLPQPSSPVLEDVHLHRLETVAGLL